MIERTPLRLLEANLDAIHALWSRPGSPGEKRAAEAAYIRLTGKHPDQHVPAGARPSSGRRHAERSGYARQQPAVKSNFTPYDPSKHGPDELQHHIDHWEKHRPGPRDGKWVRGDEKASDLHLGEVHRLAKEHNQWHTLGDRWRKPTGPDDKLHTSGLATLHAGRFVSDTTRLGGTTTTYRFFDKESAHAFHGAAAKAYQHHGVSVANPVPYGTNNAHHVDLHYPSRFAGRKHPK